MLVIKDDYNEYFCEKRLRKMKEKKTSEIINRIIPQYLGYIWDNHTDVINMRSSPQGFFSTGLEIITLIL